MPYKEFTQEVSKYGLKSKIPGYDLMAWLRYREGKEAI